MRTRLPFTIETRPTAVGGVQSDLKIRWGLDIRAQTGNYRQRERGSQDKHQATGKEPGQTQ